MGRYIDPNKPFTEDEKEYLRARGRGHQIIENERRFPDGDENAADELETSGHDPESASFDPEARSNADYDVGGAPLPGTVLDVDTGRVVPLSTRSDGAFDYIDPETGLPAVDPDAFDEDIVESVDSLTVPELKAALKAEEVDFDAKSKKEDLQDALIIARQDKRNAERAANPPANPDDEFIDPANLGNSDNSE